MCGRGRSGHELASVGRNWRQGEEWAETGVSINGSAVCPLLRLYKLLNMQAIWGAAHAAHNVRKFDQIRGFADSLLLPNPQESWLLHASGQPLQYLCTWHSHVHLVLQQLCQLLLQCFDSTTQLLQLHILGLHLRPQHQK